MIGMLHLIATAHACQRARERLRWHARTLERMLDRVFYFGAAANDCPRPLQRYLDELPHEPGQTVVRVYGQLVFIFARDETAATARLLTVYVLPGVHRAAARRVQLRPRTALALAA
jgi:hypothetical protein